MEKDFDSIVTGTLLFRGVNFVFVFDRQKLRLIPPVDEVNSIEKWFQTEIVRGVFSNDKSIYVEEPVLIGDCNEGYKIILFPVQMRSVHRFNNILIVEIEAYIWQRMERKTIGRMGFESPEIDCIFPTRKAISSTTWSKSGEITLETKPFIASITEEQQFIVDGRYVSMHFAISRKINGALTVPPLSLHSEMYFEFEPTEDYAFILRLYKIAKVFIQYLCYRENVPFASVNLSALWGEAKYEQFANLYILNDDSETETKCLKDGRYICQEHIEGREGKILSDIAAGVLYTRNIPCTYKQGRSIDAARFVMITAAFEWEFKRLYPSGIVKRPQTIDAEKNAESALEDLRAQATGKLKEIYKNLINSIRFTQLSSRIIHTGKDMGDIIDGFGKHLYRLNGQELNYSDMGERLGKQRNNFAHGNLDQEFVGLSLLDLIYLEMVVYAMQLKYYGISDLKIKRAINDLFHQCMWIGDE